MKLVTFFGVAIMSSSLQIFHLKSRLVANERRWTSDFNLLRIGAIQHPGQGTEKKQHHPVIQFNVTKFITETSGTWKCRQHVGNHDVRETD